MPGVLIFVFAIGSLLHCPALDDGIEPIMQPVIADGSKLQINPITREDIEQIYFRWGVKNEKLLGHASIRLGLNLTAGRFLNLLGNVESGLSDDLLILMIQSDKSFGLRVARVQKIRYKMLK